MSEVAFHAQLQKWRRVSLAVGAAASALCLLAAFSDRAQPARSWLVAWLFFAGLSLGSLVIVMLQSLTGGAWGRALRRLCEAAMLALPLLALLFIPILLGASGIFPWARAEAVAAHPAWQHRHAYLNLPFFTFRAYFTFGVLSLLALALRRGHPIWLPRLSGGGLVLYVFCMNFVSTDWVLSLEPDWHSTIFVIIFMIGQLLSALAVMTVLAGVFANREPLASFLSPKIFHDLGNLLLAFTVFWVYVSFSQFLIIWSGNLPKEISWYLHRSAPSWRGILLFLVLFQFLIPFALLLLRGTKRRRERLVFVAALLACTSLVELYWWVAPAFHPEGLHLHWLDFASLLAVGGLWSTLFLRYLTRLPLLPMAASLPHA